MKYEITYNDGDGWLTCQISGNIAMEDVDRFAGVAIDFLVKHPGCKSILIDAREASLPLSIMQIWQIPRILAKLAQQTSRYHDGSFYNTRRAVVVSEDNDSWRFFETVTRNLGHAVKIFTDLAAAVAWLKEETPDR